MSGRKIKKQKKLLTYKRITPVRVRKAIKGSGGIMKIIGARLECQMTSLYEAMKREGEEWDEVRLALKIERESVGDLAEVTVRDSMRQRLDMSVASTTARWYLDRRHVDRGYGKKEQVTVDGKVDMTHHTFIPIEKLDLPLDVKRQVLLAMDKFEKEEA